MDIEQVEKTEVWQLYEKGVNFNRIMKLYSDTDRNYRMYNGNQWAGLKIKGIEPIQYNIIKPIVKYKVGTINSNLYAINFSAENFENKQFRDAAKKVCELLNKKSAKVWEHDQMDYKLRLVSKDSAINDEGIIYVTYDDKLQSPVNEIINKTDILYGNEMDQEIQKQPYIIIKQRKPISEVRELARTMGVKEELLEYIVGDMNTSEEAGEHAKYEINEMCTLLTKMYKKNGTVHFEKACQYVVLQENKDSGLTLYPVEHMVWEEKKGYARGEGEVRYLIPNQLEINKTAMRRAITIKQMAYPQKVANRSKIANPGAINEVGSTIWTNEGTVDDVSKILAYTKPAQMSTDAERQQSEMIKNSRELAGAGDIATGDVNPETASGKAILAVKQASQQPLTEQLVNLKRLLEGLARIYLDMWKTYAQDGLNIEEEIADPQTGELTEQLYQVPYSVLQELQATVKVDITPKSAFDRYAQELSLENLLKNGSISLEEYVEALDDDSVMPKAKLEEIIKKRKEMQQRIQQVNGQAQLLMQQANKYMATQDDITSLGQMGQNMINQAM